MTGGTFTITNPGPYGTLISTPIINQPQVAILSTDGIKKRPVVVELPDGSDGIAIHPTGNLALSFDHRVIDGAYASAFLAHVKEILETGANDVYVVATAGGELLLPAIKDVVIEIAPERGEMVVELLPGMGAGR